VLRLLVDTSVWLDLAKRRDGQKLIHALGQVVLDGDVELLVPTLVQIEFNRNRERIERTMTTSVADRFKTLRSDLEGLTAESHAEALDALTSLAYELPLVGAMATRNFTDIQQLLDDGTQLDESDAERFRVVNRALRKRHRSTTTRTVLLTACSSSCMPQLPPKLQLRILTIGTPSLRQPSTLLSYPWRSAVTAPGYR
jgi:predicted nucleic acid-binding protein